MKTEPIEAMNYIHQVCENDMRNKGKFANIVLASKAFMGCHIAFREGQSSPKIKQLEWVEYENFHGRKSYLSKTPFSTYDVADGGDHFTMFSPNKRLRFASADEAKAAAQKDFEERVEKCIAK